MKNRYTLRWGFAVKYNGDFTYVLKYGFVFRVPKPPEGLIHGWSSYKFHSTQQMPYWRPGQIIDINRMTDMVALGTASTFIRKRGVV